MKITEAWSHVAQENIYLRVALLSLSLCSIVLGVSVTKLSLADPILIERACYTQSLKSTGTQPTEDETKTFLEIALKQRFNSKTHPVEGFLSKDELINRDKEQNQLISKKIKQNIILQNVHFNKDEIIVDVDRLYSVDSVRSALATQLKVTLEKKARTTTNPYGLILVRAEEIKTNNEKGE